MMAPGTKPRTATAVSLWVGALAVFLVGALLVVSMPALGRENPRTRGAAETGTPVAAPEPTDDPLDGDPADARPAHDDPLDGDPLDGDPSRHDADEPPDEGRLEIERSGRPETAPSSVVAYDDDAGTVWTPDEDVDESWLWLDLGDEARVRQVYWLAEGSGAIEVSVSSDRERWTSIDQAGVDESWQAVDLREDARYVRLELTPDGDGALPEIAEVAVYGRGGDGSVSREQDADGDRKRNRNRRGNRDEQSKQKADKGDGGRQNNDKDSGKSKRRNGDRDRGNTRSSGSSESGVSAEQGETSCRGNRERCRARAGKVTMEEDCETEGSCTIDVNVDGGTALCDATGGNKAKAGDGEGRKGGEGGACEAVADGGAVSIGDINP